MNPKQAMKINRQVEDAYYGFMSFFRMPFFVTMDEVVDDAFQLDGPAPFHKRLFEEDDFDFSTYMPIALKRYHRSVVSGSIIALRAVPPVSH